MPERPAASQIGGMVSPERLYSAVRANDWWACVGSVGRMDKLHQSVFTVGDIAAGSDQDVVIQSNVQKSPGIDQLLGQGDVRS